MKSRDIGCPPERCSMLFVRDVLNNLDETLHSANAVQSFVFCVRKFCLREVPIFKE